MPARRPWEDKNELLRSYRGWLFHTAIELAGLKQGGQLVQDLAQEGYIAMWRALDTYEPGAGSLPHWLTKNARWRMSEVLRRGSVFGKPEARGVHTRPESAGAVESSLEALVEAGVDWASDVDIAAMLELAYMRGRVNQALDTLSEDQRKYVRLRFWHEMSETQMYQRREVAPDVNVRGLWTGKSGARARLENELRRLA